MSEPINQSNKNTSNNQPKEKGLFSDKAINNNNTENDEAGNTTDSVMESSTTDIDIEMSVEMNVEATSKACPSNSEIVEKNISSEISPITTDSAIDSTMIKNTITNNNISTDIDSTDIDSLPIVQSEGYQTRKTTLGYGEPLKLAVVGHTNTGKTSILRTLLRDKYFGEVKNAPATTRHVERAIITDSQTNENLVALFDTPGLEDASGVMDWLENNTASRRDGVDRLQYFLASDLAKSDNAQANRTDNTESHYLEDYSQEAKVIRQLLGSDMAIYVIDVREPVLGKYKDELTILSWSAIPIMPVFNFSTEANTNMQAWQTMLARRNLHVSTQFDSVAFEFDDEMTLWSNLATMLTDEDVLNQLIARRKENWQTLHDEATIIIADFLLNVASFVREINDEEDPLPTLTEMQQAVRQAERGMQKQLTDLYKFYDSEVAPTQLSLHEYQKNPFDAEVLKAYGIRTTSGAAAGALVGVGIDVATLGASLGLGAAIGGLAGGILSNTHKITEMITGVKHLYIDPDTVTLLAIRSLDLLYKLRHRGHASVGNIQSKNLQSDIKNQNTEEQSHVKLTWSSDNLPSLLKKARSKPEWSALAGKNPEQAELLRKDASWELSNSLSLEVVNKPH